MKVITAMEPSFRNSSVTCTWQCGIDDHKCDSEVGNDSVAVYVVYQVVKLPDEISMRGIVE